MWISRDGKLTSVRSLQRDMNFLQVPSLSCDSDQPGITGFAEQFSHAWCSVLQPKQGFLLLWIIFSGVSFQTDSNSLNTNNEMQIFCFQKNETSCDLRIELARYYNSVHSSSPSFQSLLTMILWETMSKALLKPLHETSAGVLHLDLGPPT